MCIQEQYMLHMDIIFFFFFSSRRRHTRCSGVSWARRCVQETGRQKLQYSDKRSKSINEYVAGIRIVKYYGWENIVEKQISDIRDQEASQILQSAIYRSVMDLFIVLTPFSISVAVFGTYIALGNELTPAKAYTVLSLFNLMQIPLRVMIMTFVNLITAKVSLNRINHFMEAEEMEESQADKDFSQTLEVGEVQIKNGQFSWETETAKQHDQNRPDLVLSLIHI
eukprot:TRINITY_DN1924_c0_g1_i10.p1 TRINITY_DN1924_c0_g1~~TRINITY_DN1924_c0_g1_i10.p1  ORF type:complete len:224 (+),score=64.41 TRINITY_DN1924_c0_g1_i10:2-673(+)